MAEASLRVILGLRFLSSGVSNVRRWPHATETAAIVFPANAYFFGFVATALMVLGGAGLALGLQTSVSAALLIIFLIPTFKVQVHWLKTLPAKVKTVERALRDEKALKEFQLLGRHAIHAHEVGWRDNLVLLAGCLYFTARGSVAFGVDNLFEAWVIRFF